MQFPPAGAGQPLVLLRKNKYIKASMVKSYLAVAAQQPPERHRTAYLMSATGRKLFCFFNPFAEIGGRVVRSGSSGNFIAGQIP